MADARLEQVRVLGGERDRLADILLRVVTQIMVADESPVRSPGQGSTQQEVGDRGLPRSTGADQRNPLTRIQPEAQAVDRQLLVPRIPHPHILEGHRERPRWERYRRGGDR